MLTGSDTVKMYGGQRRGDCLYEGRGLGCGCAASRGGVELSLAQGIASTEGGSWRCCQCDVNSKTATSWTWNQYLVVFHRERVL